MTAVEQGRRATSVLVTAPHSAAPACGTQLQGMVVTSAPGLPRDTRLDFSDSALNRWPGGALLLYASTVICAPGACALEAQGIRRLVAGALCALAHPTSASAAGIAQAHAEHMWRSAAAAAKQWPPT